MKDAFPAPGGKKDSNQQRWGVEAEGNLCKQTLLKFLLSSFSLLRHVSSLPVATALCSTWFASTSPGLRFFVGAPMYVRNFVQETLSPFLVSVCLLNQLSRCLSCYSVPARNPERVEEKFSLPYNTPRPLHRLHLEIFHL